MLQKLAWNKYSRQLGPVNISNKTMVRTTLKTTSIKRETSSTGQTFFTEGRCPVVLFGPSTFSTLVLVKSKKLLSNYKESL